MRTHWMGGFAPLVALALGCGQEIDEPLTREGQEADEVADEDEPAATPPGPEALASDEEPLDVVTFCDPAANPPVPVNFPAEMVITNLAVVEDPCRTTLTPTVACPAGSVGVWTFAELMSRMSGTVPANVFVAEWLRTFELGSVVNGFPVPARANVRPALIDPWLVASGCAPGAPLVGAGACPLDLTRAPFRLLAIVNRVDLEDATVGEPGELRFVFGAVDLSAAGRPPLEATFIFEYELPSSLPIFDWTTRLHDLRLFPLGSAPYRNHLQSITDDVTLPGAEPGDPNLGSAIAQLRTNEIDLGGPPWKMREYHLQNVGRGFDAQALRMQPTAQSPDDSLNLSGPLDAFLAANEPLILDVAHTVPNVMLGGETSAPMLWDETGAAGILPETRHLFGFATCSGCHTDETNTAFTHVNTRNAGVASTLSPFLGVSAAPAAPGSGNPAAFQTVVDPAPSGLVFQYNEPWRRVCEVRRILGGAAVPYTRPHGAH